MAITILCVWAIRTYPDAAASAMAIEAIHENSVLRVTATEAVHARSVMARKAIIASILPWPPDL